MMAKKKSLAEEIEWSDDVFPKIETFPGTPLIPPTFLDEERGSSPKSQIVIDFAHHSELGAASQIRPHLSHFQNVRKPQNVNRGGGNDDVIE